MARPRKEACSTAHWKDVQSTFTHSAGIHEHPGVKKLVDSSRPSYQLTKSTFLSPYSLGYIHVDLLSYWILQTAKLPSVVPRYKSYSHFGAGDIPMSSTHYGTLMGQSPPESMATGLAAEWGDGFLQFPHGFSPTCGPALTDVSFVSIGSGSLPMQGSWRTKALTSWASAGRTETPRHLRCTSHWPSVPLRCSTPCRPARLAAPVCALELIRRSIDRGRWT